MNTTRNGRKVRHNMGYLVALHFDLARWNITINLLPLALAPAVLAVAANVLPAFDAFPATTKAIIVAAAAYYSGKKIDPATSLIASVIVLKVTRHRST